MNHYPLIGRKVPSSCNDADGTANPFASVTCLACRARLAKAAENKRKGAISFKPRSQERKVFFANAESIEVILAHDLVMRAFDKLHALAFVEIPLGEV